MLRRNFISMLGAALAAAPAGAFAQTDRVRRLGLLLSQFEGSAEANERIAALQEGLQKLGWTDGRNIKIDVRYASGSADRMRAHALELVQLAPDVLVASATSSLAELHRATTTIPIVFAQVTDPVGAGFVKSLARPFHPARVFHRHQMVGTAQGACSANQACRADLRSAESRDGGLPVRDRERHAVIPGAIVRASRARRHRNRARVR
jgi:hypothetical protein